MKACSLWELSAAVEGHLRANGGAKARSTAPTDDEDEALRAKYG